MISAVIVFSCIFLHQILGTARPDLEIAVVTADYTQVTFLKGLEEKAESDTTDLNHDGKVKVNVNFYQYRQDPESAENPKTEMASSVQLAADLKNHTSVLYFTNCPEILMRVDSELQEGNTYMNLTVLYRGDAGKELMDKMTGGTL